MFLAPLIYALIFFNNSWEFKALWSVILTALFNGIAILCTSIFSKVLSPSSSYLEIGSADRVAFVVSSNVILAVSLYFVTRLKRSPRVGFGGLFPFEFSGRGHHRSPLSPAFQ